jgi:hypothetical protein
MNNHVSSMSLHFNTNASQNIPLTSALQTTGLNNPHHNNIQTVPTAMEITNVGVPQMSSTVVTYPSQNTYSEEVNRIRLDTQTSSSLSSSLTHLTNNVTFNSHSTRSFAVSPLQLSHLRGMSSSLNVSSKDPQYQNPSITMGPTSNSSVSLSSSTAVHHISTTMNSFLHCASPQSMSISRPTISHSLQLDHTSHVSGYSLSTNTVTTTPMSSAAATTTTTTSSSSSSSSLQRRPRRHAPVNLATIYLMDTCIELTNVHFLSFTHSHTITHILFHFLHLLCRSSNVFFVNNRNLRRTTTTMSYLVKC